MNKACRNCRSILTGDKCANCGGTDLTKSFEGAIFIVDAADSKIAQAIGAKFPGKYALKIK
ncbi:transcription elongation factor Spt4 [Candidatus Micrarchaeota archaeon]|nr:transcription elongation factor Spt4 [Candidatus Micrarchaeota archaeon]